MKKIETGEVRLRSGDERPCGLQVDLEPMEIYKDKRMGLTCERSLVDVLTEEFVACGPALVRGCPELGDKVRPICPFDPIDQLDKIKVAVRIDELQARVQELEAKISK